MNYSIFPRESTINITDPSKTRRRSICNFFSRQDAVEMTSPAPNKKVVKPSETVVSLTDEKKVTSPPAQAKSKRATSFIKKKTPPLKRGYSDNSKLKMNRSLGRVEL